APSGRSPTASITLGANLTASGPTRPRETCPRPRRRKPPCRDEPTRTAHPRQSATHPTRTQGGSTRPTSRAASRPRDESERGMMNDEFKTAAFLSFIVHHFL